ncbi:hypothetical protein ACP70R_018969 [Stipagrostis hirtigluma subsp. patula]
MSSVWPQSMISVAFRRICTNNILRNQDQEVMSADDLYASQTAHVQIWIIYHQTFRRSSPLKPRAAMEDMMATVLVCSGDIMALQQPTWKTNTDHIVGNKVPG